MKPTALSLMIILSCGCLQLPPSTGEGIRKPFLDAVARPHRIEAYQRQGKSRAEAERLAERDETRTK
ncbi:hypothetical protein OVA24_13655 [Luteolibacter sp. SL250]|uniref:hypothetical protein n=1 Tax=Luteolibacter sp. SL250 TaxID=2995170 RepID=UPI002270653B|nr:hypothetical protein [Luteolibacter sp. SL250]WAC18280.1 hypothetical protein OVA24_13655 [Luteolibacter sp. SL250]